MARPRSRGNRIVLAVTLVLLLILALPLVLLLVAPMVYSGLVQRVVLDTAGFELSYDDVRVDLLPLEITVSGVILRNPGFREPVMTGRTVRGQVMVLDYLQGAPTWWSAGGAELRVRLEQNARGQSNWRPLGAQDRSQEPQQESSLLPAFSKLAFTDVHLIRAGEVTHQAQFSEVRLEQRADESLAVNVDGRYRDHPLRVTGVLALPSSERAREVDLEVVAVGGELSVDGRVGHDGIVPGHARFAADFQDLSGLGALLAMDLGVLQPLVLKGSLAAPEPRHWELAAEGVLGERDVALDAAVVTGSSGYELRAMTLAFGDTSLQAQGQVDPTAQRVQGTLDAERLVVDQWLALAELAGGEPPERSGSPLTVPVPAALAQWTYQLDLAAERLEYQDSVIEGLSLAVADGEDAVRVDGRVEAFAGQGSWQLVEPLQVTAIARLADAGTRLGGIEAEFTTDGFETRLDAALPTPGDDQVEAQLQTDLRALSAIRAERSLTATFDDLLPLQLEVTASGNAATVDLRIQAANVAGTQLSGELTVEPQATPLAIRGTLRSPEVDLNTIPTTRRLMNQSDSESGNGQDQDQQAGDSDGSDGLISDDPLDWSWLHAAVVNVSAEIDRLAFNQTTFGDVRTEVSLKDGRLMVDPIAAQLSQGGVRGHLHVTAQEPGAVVDTRLIVSQLVPADLGQPQQGLIDGGATDLAVDLRAQGASLQALVATLDGEFALEVQRATLRNDLFERFTSDVIVQTLNSINPFIESDPTTELDCAAVHLVAEDGVVTSRDRMVIETSKVVIRAGGTVDLEDESLKLDFVPSPRQGLGISVGGLAQLVRIGGTLRNPQVQIDPEGLLKGGASVGAAIATGGVSLLAQGLFARARNAGTACGEIFEKHIDVPKAIRVSEEDAD